MVFLDPIDQFEVALQRGTAKGESLLGLDFVAALEFSVLRFLKWENRNEDVLDLIPELAEWPALRNLRALASHCELFQMENGHHVAFRPGETRVLVQQFSSEARDWEPGGLFAHFQDQFRIALRNQGMDAAFASGLAGALHEMVSNSVEHANSPVRPVACFEVGQRAWTFGVVDVGRGVLASLRENPDYADLRSETDALTRALQPGVSRFREGGRGTGFTTVFKALVDRRTTLRFRSGGASARWEGQNATDQTITARSLPLSRIGFLVRAAGPLG
jgi:hypothetical protein